MSVARRLELASSVLDGPMWESPSCGGHSREDLEWLLLAELASDGLELGEYDRVLARLLSNSLRQSELVGVACWMRRLRMAQVGQE